MDTDQRIQKLEREIALVEAKRQVLHSFMTEAKSHEGDLFSWLVNQVLNGAYPGKELGLTVDFNGQIYFDETGDSHSA